MAISTYLANELLDHILQVGAYSAPTVYLAVSTTDPATTLTEPVGNNYSRVALSGKYSAAALKSSANTALISFPQASGSWGTITHFAVCDNSSGGAVVRRCWTAVCLHSVSHSVSFFKTASHRMVCPFRAVGGSGR